MSEEPERPWWAYTKEEQKQRIEAAIDEFLSRPGALTDRQKLFLRDALGHTYRGLFGIAAQDLYLLGAPEDAWSDSARVLPAMVEGITRESLRRVLEALRLSPVQERPVFM